MQIVTATELKSQMKEIFNHSSETHEPVIVKRPHGKNMAIIELEEYESLKETAYLLGNPANATHLATSLAELNAGDTVEKDWDKQS